MALTGGFSMWSSLKRSVTFLSSGFCRRIVLFTGTCTIILCFSCHPPSLSYCPGTCGPSSNQRPSLLMISFRTLPERRVAVRVFDVVQFSFAASTVPHAAISMSLRFWWKIRERLDSHQVLIICDGSFAFRHEATWTSDRCRARNTDAHILIGDDAPTSRVLNSEWSTFSRT